MASPELEATPSSIVVNVHHGRAKHAIEIPISATIAELKAKLAVASSVPLGEQCLMSRGKCLSDTDAVRGLEKVMMIRRPPKSTTSTPPRKRTLNLRCICSGRIVRAVEFAADARISDVLTTAKKALGIPPQESVALFAETGKMILRPDLALTDYASIFTGDDATQLFVCPDPNRLPTGPMRMPMGGAEMDTRAVAMRAALPRSSPPTAEELKAVEAMMTSRMPQADREMLAALAAVDPVEHRHALEAMHASLSGALRDSGLALGDVSLPMAGAASSSEGKPPVHTAESGSTSEASPQAPAASGGVSASQAASSSRLPVRMSTGMLGGASRARPGGMPAMMLPVLDPRMEAQLEAALRDRSGSEGSRLPMGGIDLTAELGSKQGLSSTAARLEGEMFSCFESEVKRNHEEHYEKACAKMVEALRPVESIGGPSEPRRAAKSEKEERLAKKKEAASFGSGLQKGFFGRKRKVSRPAKKAAEAVPAKAAVAAVDKENDAHALTSGAQKAPAGKQVAAASRGDRCAECDCRLPITASLQSRCRCGALYCGKHMHCHTCSFDWRGAAKRQLTRDQPVIAPVKL